MNNIISNSLEKKTKECRDMALHILNRDFKNTIKKDLLLSNIFSKIIMSSGGQPIKCITLNEITKNKAYAQSALNISTTISTVIELLIVYVLKSEDFKLNSVQKGHFNFEEEI